MFEPTELSGAVQPALFTLTRTEDDPPDGSARWVYPCGLCGTVEVTDDGRLCTSCAPVPVRKPNRTRKTAKTTTAKAATAKTSKGTGRRAKPDRASTKPVRAARTEGGGGR